MTSEILKSALSTGDKITQEKHHDNVNPDITFKTLEQLNEMLKDSQYSKNFKKKISKQIKWIETRDERIQKRKDNKVAKQEKDKLKRKRYKERVDESEKEGNTNKYTLEAQPSYVYKKRKVCTSNFESEAEKTQFDKLYHIAVDLDKDLDELMNSGMVKMLGNQLSWVYKVNRKLKHPTQIWFCKMQERLKHIMNSNYDGFDNWDIHNCPDLGFEELAEKSNKNSENESTNTKPIIYLSADSQTTIQKFEPGKIYVIGGLVDRNTHKNYCQNKAEKMNISTAKLPLNQFVDFEEIKRPLTVNHVAEIIIKINNKVIDLNLSEDKQHLENQEFREIWQQAVVSTLPKRKNLVKKPVS